MQDARLRVGLTDEATLAREKQAEIAHQEWLSKVSHAAVHFFNELTDVLIEQNPALNPQICMMAAADISLKASDRRFIFAGAGSLSGEVTKWYDDNKFLDRARIGGELPFGVDGSPPLKLYGDELSREFLTAYFEYKHSIDEGGENTLNGAESGKLKADLFEAQKIKFEYFLEKLPVQVFNQLVDFFNSIFLAGANEENVKTVTTKAATLAYDYFVASLKNDAQSIAEIESKIREQTDATPSELENLRVRLGSLRTQFQKYPPATRSVILKTLEKESQKTENPRPTTFPEGIPELGTSPTVQSTPNPNP